MTEPEPPESQQWPGYAVAAGSYTAPPVRHTSHTRLFLILGVTLAVVVGVAVWVAWLITPTPVHRMCPPHCGAPPTWPPAGIRPEVGGGRPLGMGPIDRSDTSVQRAGTPVTDDLWTPFTDPDGKFAFDYIATKHSKKIPGGMLLSYSAPNGDLLGEVTLFGEPALGRTAHDIARGLVKADYPGATDGPEPTSDESKPGYDYGYEIPNALLGYQPGYGEIDNSPSVNPDATSTVHRVLVMVAVKNDVALVAAAVGPYDENFPSDHFSGAHLDVADIVGDIVNRFTWAGDPIR
jgi:hypothetical protein